MSLVGKHKAISVASEFAAQQLSNNVTGATTKENSQTQAPRIIAPNISFQNMYSTIPINEPRTLITKVPDNNSANDGAFFVQLYNK